jgi:hypothetical protein
MTNNLDGSEINKIVSFDFATVRKNFIILKINDALQYSININSVDMPFGIEDYNDKKILNFELRNDKNYHYNYYSHFNSIDSKLIELINSPNTQINLKQIFNNKTFVPTPKKSIFGHTIRTHITTTSQIYVLVKNNKKIILPHSDKSKYFGDIHLILRGLWYNDTSYGLYWMIDNINVKKIM